MRRIDSADNFDKFLHLLKFTFMTCREVEVKAFFKHGSCILYNDHSLIRGPFPLQNSRDISTTCQCLHDIHDSSIGSSYISMFHQRINARLPLSLFSIVCISLGVLLAPGLLPCSSSSCLIRTILNTVAARHVA